MNVKIDLNGENQGELPYNYLASISYFFQVCGYEVNWDRDSQKIHLLSTLGRKKIYLYSNAKPQLPQKNELERRFLENIQNFLFSCKVNVEIKNGNEQPLYADLHLKLSFFKDHSINKPIVELSHNLGMNQEKWIAFFQNELSKEGTAFSVNQMNEEKEPTIMIELKYPELSDDLIWTKYGENFSVIITMGILSYLQGETPVFPLSTLPPEIFSGIFEKFTVKKHNNMKQHSQSEEITVQKRRESKAYFDYHLFLNRNDPTKVKVIANFIIKNAGTEILKNPTICFRMTPPGSMILSGQILPPKAVEVFGVMSDTGIKGWKYMKEDWYQQIEDTGEIWISSIQSLNIEPNQTETIANLQFDVRDIEEHENILVEAFVFYNEGELKTAAENRISLSLEIK